MKVLGLIGVAGILVVFALVFTPLIYFAAKDATVMWHDMLKDIHQ